MYTENNNILNSIYSRYYNYFKIILKIDITLDVLKDINFTIESPVLSDLELDIIDFLLEISKEIYNINTQLDRKKGDNILQLIKESLDI